MWNRTVTIYHKTEINGVPSWHRENYAHCFVKKTDGNTQSAGNSKNNYSAIVRIPKGRKVEAAAGDILIFGKVTDEADELTKGKRISDICRKYESIGNITIKAFTDNTNFALAHYLIKGD